MTVINAVGSLPGLGRLLVNMLTDVPTGIERDELYARLLPEPLHSGKDPFSNIDTTITALKDIGIIEEVQKVISLVPQAKSMLVGPGISRPAYRKLLLNFIFSSVVDPWRVTAGDTLTSGTKDINRALSWSLAQDVQSTLTWHKNDGSSVSVELMQQDQLPDTPDLRPFANDVRWNTFVRWSTALGMAQPAFQGTGIYPDATVAVRDVVVELSPGRISIDDFLDAITRRLPVLSGGALHSSFLEHSPTNPDPDAAAGLLDTTVAQALLALEDEGILSVLPPQADAASRNIGLGRTPPRRITHIEVCEGHRK